MNIRRYPVRYLARGIVPIVLIALVLAPLYWTVLVAARSQSSSYQAPPNFLPTGIDIEGILTVFDSAPLGTWLLNSLVVSGATTLFAMLVGLPAGYAVARFQSKISRGAAGTVLLTQVTPPIVLLVPLFIVFRSYGLIDSLFGVILADLTIVLPLIVWLGAAMVSQIPREIDDAATIDGCSYWGVFLRAILPSLKPAYGAIAVYSFIEVWDEFLYARSLLTSQSHWTASMGLYSFKGANFVPLNQVMFTALLFTAVPMVLFFLMRKSLVTSMTAGSVKG